MQKIRTVELDGKVIKLQIVSADQGVASAEVAPVHACMREPLAPASGMHACCRQLNTVHETLTGYREVVVHIKRRRQNVF